MVKEVGHIQNIDEEGGITPSTASALGLAEHTPTTSKTGQPRRELSALERKVEKTKKKLPKWMNCVQKVFQCFWNYLTRLFTVPLKRDPIYFHRADNEVIINRNSDVGYGGGTGVRCDYEEAAKALFEKVFDERKEKMKGRDIHDIAYTINLKNYPGWDDSIVDQLRNEFEACKQIKPGQIDFEELNQALDNFGQKSTRAERKVHFDVITDQDQYGFLDFEEFCTMAYNLGKTVDNKPETLQELYKNLDRDLSSIRNLNIVDQIQAGLF